jgi:hypothetical protein
MSFAQFDIRDDDFRSPQNAPLLLLINALRQYSNAPNNYWFDNILQFGFKLPFDGNIYFGLSGNTLTDPLFVSPNPIVPNPNTGERAIFSWHYPTVGYSGNQADALVGLVHGTVNNYLDAPIIITLRADCLLVYVASTPTNIVVQKPSRFNNIQGINGASVSGNQATLSTGQSVLFYNTFHSVDFYHPYAFTDVEPRAWNGTGVFVKFITDNFPNLATFNRALAYGDGASIACDARTFGVNSQKVRFYTMANNILAEGFPYIGFSARYVWRNNFKIDEIYMASQPLEEVRAVYTDDPNVSTYGTGYKPIIVATSDSSTPDNVTMTSFFFSVKEKTTSFDANGNASLKLVSQEVYKYRFKVGTTQARLDWYARMLINQTPTSVFGSANQTKFPGTGFWNGKAGTTRIWNANAWQPFNAGSGGYNYITIFDSGNPNQTTNVQPPLALSGQAYKLSDNSTAFGYLAEIVGVCAVPRPDTNTVRGMGANITANFADYGSNPLDNSGVFLDYSGGAINPTQVICLFARIKADTNAVNQYLPDTPDIVTILGYPKYVFRFDGSPFVMPKISNIQLNPPNPAPNSTAQITITFQPTNVSGFDIDVIDKDNDNWLGGVKNVSINTNNPSVTFNIQIPNKTSVSARIFLSANVGV